MQNYEFNNWDSHNKVHQTKKHEIVGIWGMGWLGKPEENRSLWGTDRHVIRLN